MSFNYWSKLLNTPKVIWSSISRQRRRQLIVLQFLSILSAIAEVGNLGALLPFLELLSNPNENIQKLGPLALFYSAIPEKYTLVSLGFSFLALVTISTILRVFTIRFQLRLAAFISSDLGSKVFESVLGKSFSWHLTSNTSAVIGYLTKDVDQANGSIQAILNLIVNFVSVLLILTTLLLIAPKLVISTGILLLLFYLVVFHFTRAVLKSFGLQRTMAYQASLKVAQEGLGGIRDIIIDKTQTFYLESYQKEIKKYRLAMAAISLRALSPRYLIDGFSVILIVSVVLYLIISGQTLTNQLPIIGTIILGAYRMLQPMNLCFTALANLQANQASIIKLQPFLLSKTQCTRSENYHKNYNELGRKTSKTFIVIKDLSFRYSEDSPWIIENLNLSIKFGERIAFVGSTGSGKSTICDIILGLLKPTKGFIKVNGVDINESKQSLFKWQEYVSHVPQYIFLSDSSFKSNIAFGVNKDIIDQNKLTVVANLAKLENVIESSPNGFDSMVGERGVRLSGGQRQRIGIARALYKDSELIVLDEATSALDNLTEAAIMDSIQNYKSSKTIIIIAHRLSTVSDCDKIILLENGKIEGCGTFDELKNHNKIFQNLLKNQTS